MGATSTAPVIANQPSKSFWLKASTPRRTVSTFACDIARRVFRTASGLPLSDDERVVALDPAVRGEDEEAEPDCEHLAVLGDRLPVELDDVAESFGVVAPAEAEPLGADPVLVRRSPREPRSPRIPVPRGSPSWRSRVAPRSRGSPAAAGGCASRPRVQSSAIIRRRRSASGSFQSATYFSANSAALRDEISTKACVSVIGYLR